MRSLTKLLSAICLVAIAVCLTITNISCNRLSKCGTGTCANGGVCDNETCTCPAGYQGSTCQTVSRNAFLGNWSASENGSETQGAQYPVSILESKQAVNDIIITNFLNHFTDPVNAYVINDSLFIPYQKLDGYTIQGNGCLLTNRTIVISYVETTLLSNLIVAGVITLR